MMLARKSKRKVVDRKLVVKMCSAIVSPNWMNTLKKASKWTTIHPRRFEKVPVHSLQKSKLQNRALP